MTIAPEIVEKAATEFYLALRGKPAFDLIGASTKTGYRQSMRRALATVLPDIQRAERERCLRAISTLSGYSAELERAHAAIRALEDKPPPDGALPRKPPPSSND